MHTDHTSIERIVTVICPLSHQGITDRRIQLFGKGTHFFRSAGKNCSAAQVNIGLFRLGNHFQRSIQFFLRVMSGTFNRFRLFGCIFAACCRYIFGDINQYRSGSAGFCNVERLAQRVCQNIDIFYNVTVFGDRHRHACDIDLLEGIFSQKRQRYITGNRYHRDGIHVRGRNAGNQIRRAGTTGRHTHTDFSGCTRIAICCMCSTLFMRCQHMENLIAMLV